MLPDPPVNVRVVLLDDTELVVDTVYVGKKDHTHIWQVLDSPPLTQISGLRIDVLPPHTQITLRDGYRGP
jgi:hypothetical protein